MIAIVVAQRGRYGQNGNIEQHYEVGGEICNTLTSVQKDNLVIVEANNEQERE